MKAGLLLVPLLLLALLLVGYNRGHADQAQPDATPIATGPTPTAALGPLEDSSVTYQINPAHNGNLQGSSLRPPLKQLWSVELGGIVSYPLVRGDKVYVAVANSSDAKARLYALDTSTGDVEWGPVELGGNYIAGIALYNERIFAVNYGGILQAFNAQTGVSLWTIILNDLVTAAPTAWDSQVYVGGKNAVYALRQDNGAIQWVANQVGGDHSSPAVSESGVYVSYMCPNVFALDPVNGSLKWKYTGGCTGGGGRTPALYNDKLYARQHSQFDSLTFNANTGAPGRTFQATTIPAFNGEVGFFLHEGRLSAIEQDAGQTIWTFGDSGSVNLAPIVVGDTLYTATAEGTLFAISSTNGKQLFSTSLPAQVERPDEHNARMLTGLGAGDGKLFVPASTWLVAFEHDPNPPTPTATPTNTPLPAPPTSENNGNSSETTTQPGIQSNPGGQETGLPLTDVIFTLVGNLFRGATNILVPYLIPFLLLLTIAWTINVYSWASLHQGQVKQAGWLWAVSNALGFVTLWVGLMAALFMYALAATFLEAPPAETMVMSTTSFRGMARLGFMFLAGGIVWAVLTATSAVLLWLVFRHRLSNLDIGNWMWLQSRAWPIGFIASLSIAIMLAASFLRMQPIFTLVVCGVIFGALTGKRLGEIAEGTHEPGEGMPTESNSKEKPLKARAPLASSSSEWEEMPLGYVRMEMTQRRNSPQVSSIFSLILVAVGLAACISIGTYLLSPK